MAVELREARVEDIEPFCRYIREADLAEIDAAEGCGPRQVLYTSLMLSRNAWTGTIDGEPAAMAGVGSCSMLSDHGRCWFLGTTLMDRRYVTVAKMTRDRLPEMRRGWRTIGNHIDVRHKQGVRWISWLGFKLGEPQFYGIKRMPFYPFEMDGLD